MGHNACISLLSSRDKCLPLCLESIHKFYNYRYNYPIYVHYFDDIYDGFKVDTPNVEFIQVPYKTPEHIPESEMFYNRDNAYAKKFFPKSRKGYLHMCNFIVNMYKYPKTKIHEHDYVIVFDDESGFVKEYPDLLSGMTPMAMAAMITGQRLKNGHIPSNHIATRIGLWDFVVEFLEHLPWYLLATGPDRYHMLPWSDGYVIGTEVYRTCLWDNWVTAVNKSGGIYKYRWGDNEIMSLFAMIFNNLPMYNLRIVEDGYLKQDLFRHIQNIAPGVKDNDR